MSLIRFTAACALLLLAACAAPPVGNGPSVARNASAAVHEVVLDNGLKVIVKEDHRAPVVVSQIWYKVGASDEPDGLTGISHVLEHLMFKGTPKYPAGSFSRIIAENGGRENAFTGPDYTAYFQTLEKSRLPVAFELEADRMRNLVLDPAEFAKEVRVVMEERRLRTDDQPEALAYEKFMNTAYRVHSYKNPIIGWMRDLEKMTIADVRAWYRRWYVPNNATLVVAGDVEPRAVVALARQHFGPIPAGRVERTHIPAEPPQIAPRRSTLKAPAQVPNLIIGYHVPAYGHAEETWEPYALMVLNGILGGGNSSRFQRELVRGTAVASGIASGYNAAARHPGLFTINGTPVNGQTVRKLEAAVRAQIRRLQDEPVTAEELERIKAQVVASDVYQRDSVFYQAMKIGTLETVGLDWRLADDFVARLRAVTAAQVQAVAKKYLIESNMTVTVLEPQPGRPKPRRPAPPGGGHGR